MLKKRKTVKYLMKLHWNISCNEKSSNNISLAMKKVQIIILRKQTNKRMVN